jgi:hypothetical protein
MTSQMGKRKEQKKKKKTKRRKRRKTRGENYGEISLEMLIRSRFVYILESAYIPTTQQDAICL